MYVYLIPKNIQPLGEQPHPTPHFFFPLFCYSQVTGTTTLLARPCKGTISGLKWKIPHEKGKGSLRKSSLTDRSAWCSSASNPSYAVRHGEDTALKHRSTEEHRVMDCRQLLEYGSNLKNPFHSTRLHQDNKAMWLCYYIRMRTDWTC